MLSRVEFRCATEWANSLAGMSTAGRMLEPFGPEAWRSALLTVRLLLLGLNPKQPFVPPAAPLPLNRRQGQR
jgi:hypothetical protein